MTGLLYGIIPVIIQSVVSAENIASAMALFLRFLIGTIMLAPFACRQLRHTSVPKSVFMKIPVSSVLMSATSLLLYASYAHIPTGIGVTLHYTYPLIVMITSTVLFKIRVSWQSVIAIALSAAGILSLCNGRLSSDSAPVGIILALASSCTFCGYFLWTEHQKLNQIDPVVLTAILSGINSVLILFYCLLTNQFSLHLSLKGFAILALGGVMAALGALCLTLAIKYIGSVHTSILGTLEPIVCTLGSALVLHEELTARTFLGCGLIVISVIIVTIYGSDKAKLRG